MKKVLFALFIILFCSSAYALNELKYLTPPYWVVGKVADTAEAAVGTRNVYFYFDQAALDVGDYAKSSAFSNQFLLNAYSIFPANLTVGQTYKVSTEQDEKGYGADGTVIISGVGWDEVKGMGLRLGGGIRPPSVSLLDLPKIEDIIFGKRRWQKALFAKGEKFIVSSSPKISAKVSSQHGIKVNSIKVAMNEGTPLAKTYSISTANIVKSSGAESAPTEVVFELDLSKMGEKIPEGEQTFAFRASNIYGATMESASVKVLGGAPRIEGIPIVYPSPIRLATDRSVTFQYQLSDDMNIDIFVFDISARVAKKLSFLAREEGGSGDGVNKPTWDLITDQGSIMASGIYLAHFVNRDTGKLLGKVKVTAVP